MYAWVAVQILHSPHSEDTQCVSLYPLPIIIKPTLRTLCVNIRHNELIVLMTEMIMMMMMMIGTSSVL